MTNYSFETSLPAFKENQTQKRVQRENILRFIKKGADNLLQLSQITGIPQSTVSARMKELRKDQKADYLGYVVYENRKRKKIVAVVKKELTQPELFN